MSAAPGNILRPRPRLRWLAWLAAAISVGAATWLCVQLQQQAERAERLGTEAQVLRSRLTRRPAPPPSRAVLEERRRWDSLAGERAFNWYPVFRGLEQASSADIELLEFLPDKANRRITLHGEARDMAALTAYMQALGQQQPFADVYLARQKNLSRAGLSLLSFELRARIQ